MDVSKIRDRVDGGRSIYMADTVLYPTLNILPILKQSRSIRQLPKGLSCYHKANEVMTAGPQRNQSRVKPVEAADK